MKDQCTPDEILASKKRRDQIYSELADRANQPVWAQQMEQTLQQQIQQTQQQMTTLQQGYQRHENMIFVTSATYEITKVQNDAGNVPGDNIWFRTVSDLEQVTDGTDLNGLLQFYNRATNGNLRAKKTRVNRALGIRI